jgi:hypothetical protein
VILLELTTIRCSKIPPASLYHPSSHCKPVPAPECGIVKALVY